jgi:hypothetical protein
LAIPFALLRTANAVPFLLVMTWLYRRERRGIALSTLIATSMLLAFTAVATVRLPNWIHEYLAALTTYQYGAPLDDVVPLSGPLHLLIVDGGGCALALWIASVAKLKGMSRRTILALILAWTVIMTPFSAPYAAIFALPAILVQPSRESVRRLLLGVWLAVPWISIVSLPTMAAFQLAVAVEGGLALFTLAVPFLAIGQTQQRSSERESVIATE